MSKVGSGLLPVWASRACCEVFPSSPKCFSCGRTDCKLQQKAQIDIKHKKKKNHAKKITGFQFAPGNPSEVLITSADSRIRVYDGVQLIHKFRGFRNTSSQISASFTPDGSYVVCASEDSHVYVWKREEHRGGTGKKSHVSTRSYENFSCKDVSVAVPWPGSIRYEHPSAIPSSRFCPSPMQSPDQGASSSASIMSSHEDNFSSSRSHCPPLPKKSSPDQPQSCTEEELRNPSRSGSSIGNTSSSWLWSGPLSGLASTRLSGGQRGATQVVTAWGMVVVAAGLGGEIRVFQNFGLPVRLKKQAALH